MSSDDLLREAIGDRSPLISAERLEGLLGNPAVKLFDVRGTWRDTPRGLPADYDAGHIPGAVFLDWTAEFIEQGLPPRLADVSDEAGTRASLERLGIDEGDLVVLYDDYHNMLAGRIWWALRYWGFESVRVLDGGWSGWKVKGLPQSTETSLAASNGSAQPKRQDRWRLDLDRFLAARTSACVLDARGPVSYAGDPEDPRTGHIPGALHVPYSSMLDPDSGCFLDDDALRRVFEEAAPDWQSRPIIASCGSGYSATVLMLALEKLGMASTLFDGSVAVWKADPARPLRQGMAP